MADSENFTTLWNQLQAYTCDLWATWFSQALQQFVPQILPSSLPVYTDAGKSMWHTCSAPWGHTGCFWGRQSLWRAEISSISLSTHSVSHSVIQSIFETYLLNTETLLGDGKATRDLQASPTDIQSIKQRTKWQEGMHIIVTTASDREQAQRGWGEGWNSVHRLRPLQCSSLIVHPLVAMLTASTSWDKADNDTSHCSNSGTAMPPH